MTWAELFLTGKCKRLYIKNVNAYDIQWAHY